MNDFDRDPDSRTVSNPARVDAPLDSYCNAPTDIAPASEDGNANDPGNRDVVASIINSPPPHTLSTQGKGPTDAEASGR
jgi:hypothetical protein